MSVSNESVSVGTSATLLVQSDHNKEYVYLQDGDFDGDSVTYVGGSGVTVANGIKLSKTNQLVFELYEYDSLYAVSDSASGEVRVVVVK